MTNEDGETLYVYEVVYADSRCGDQRRTTVVATDEGRAVIKAQEDYYFGSLQEVAQQWEASEEDLERYP